MDPVDLPELRFILATDGPKGSRRPPRVSISAEKLQPGCVLAGTDLDRHVLVEAPTPINHTMVALRVRSMYGGHTLRVRRKRTTKVEIFARQLAFSSIRSIPAVPRPFVPEDPQPGDRIAFQFIEQLTLAQPYRWTYVWTGESWRRESATLDVRGVRHLVSEARQGFFTYIPAGHRPHLHVDGAPQPARHVEDLIVGDVLRFPGGARAWVLQIEEQRASYRLKISVLTPTSHTHRHMFGLGVTGTILEGFDGYGSGALYATEPREGELVGAHELRIGDTVITSYGLPYSTVAEVEDVWRQPASTTMHVQGTACDGRPVRTQTGLDNQYMVLHRDRSFSAFHKGLCAQDSVY